MSKETIFMNADRVQLPVSMRPSILGSAWPRCCPTVFFRELATLAMLVGLRARVKKRNKEHNKLIRADSLRFSRDLHLAQSRAASGLSGSLRWHSEAGASGFGAQQGPDGNRAQRITVSSLNSRFVAACTHSNSSKSLLLSGQSSSMTASRASTANSLQRIAEASHTQDPLHRS